MKNDESPSISANGSRNREAGEFITMAKECGEHELKLQHIMLMARMCLLPKLTYTLRTSHPGDVEAEVLGDTQKVINALIKAILGTTSVPETAYLPPQPERSGLPQAQGPAAGSICGCIHPDVGGARATSGGLRRGQRDHGGTGLATNRMRIPREMANHE